MAGSGKGYTNVSDDGFLGFGEALTVGPWAEAPDFTNATEAALDAAVLDRLPRTHYFKLRLTLALRALSATVETADTISALDAAWGDVQRRLDGALVLATLSAAEDDRLAASRLRAVLLTGNGRLQTTLSADAEVDFGLAQGLHARAPDFARDIQRLGLEAILDDVAATTHALARAVGRDSATRRLLSPSRRLRQARAECIQTANAVHDELEWMITHAAPGPVRTHYQQLLDTLVTVLARHAARAKRRAATTEAVPSGEAPSVATRGG